MEVHGKDLERKILKKSYEDSSKTFCNKEHSKKYCNEVREGLREKLNCVKLHEEVLKRARGELHVARLNPSSKWKNL